MITDEYLYCAVDAETGEVQDVATSYKRQRYFVQKSYLDAKLIFRSQNKYLRPWKIKRVKIVEVEDADDVENGEDATRDSIATDDSTTIVNSDSIVANDSTAEE